MTIEHINSLLAEMTRLKASDLYLTHGIPPGMRVDDAIKPVGDACLSDEDLERYLSQLLSPDQLDEFRSMLELNTAYVWQESGRFRINVFRQQGHPGVVIRRIRMEIPTLADLNLPAAYADVALMKRGLVLIAGPTSSGKTTSLAAMINHRNTNGQGHILTIEDPIEFVHGNKQCIVTQRDVGLDTYSYPAALKNALRQRPDLVIIGEARDREVMEQAIYFAETGHLCIATVHANNSSQAVERVLNFFPEERHRQILLNLAVNLKAILSQRLVNNLQGTRTLAMEVMLNNGLIKQLIEEGKIRQLREMIEKGSSDGMQTFDQCLLDLYDRKIISEETAFAEADSPTNIRLAMSTKKKHSKVVSHEMLLMEARQSEATAF